MDQVEAITKNTIGPFPASLALTKLLLKVYRISCELSFQTLTDSVLKHSVYLRKNIFIFLLAIIVYFLPVRPL